MATIITSDSSNDLCHNLLKDSSDSACRPERHWLQCDLLSHSREVKASSLV